MVGTRSRVYSNNVVVPKRKYTKRKTVQSDPVQINEQSNEQTNEQSIEQVDPTNSIHLELDESLNNDNNDLTFDGFDRIVSRNRVISSEDETVVEKKPKEYKNSLKGIYSNIYYLIFMHIIIYYILGKKKAAVYEKIAGRSFKFETEAQIDTYIRTINQCNFKITNNNPVKCSIIDCNQTHKHKMKKVF